eukprot:GHVL01042593.1.p1 GENE.GHVL01042593.1~~GHVL01042593.1.p1  ORF type:complete len:598 (+),score=120.92 GHVL01042593.1:665-2458(+)
MQTCNKWDPHRVLRRWNSRGGLNISSESIKKEVLKAMVYTSQIDYISLSRIFDNYHDENHEMNDLKITFDPTRPTINIDPSVPIPINIQSNNKTSLWKLLRYSSTLLIVLAAASVFAEAVAGNMQKGLGLVTKKIDPVTDMKTTFDDVKGCNEVKEEVEEIIQYLKDPAKFERLGAKLPKGILLHGAPGTGKTLIARAMAGEAKVPFIQVSGSEFEEMYVGVGARRIRDLFAAARKLHPCIIFIDEIDAVGSKRSDLDRAGVRMTLNQLLVELDGFEQNERIVVICATNFPQSLDPALTRPGRLDKTVVIPLPDLEGRLEILKMYGDRIVMDEDIDLMVMAKRTAGMTGADLFNVINIAAMRASSMGKDTITMDCLENAFDRVIVGLERRNPMSEEEKKMTAFHEGGHLMVAKHTRGCDPVHKATIMPRGNALGITWQIPLAEKFSHKYYELQCRMDTLMGGRAAEELIFGVDNVTAGCSSDVKQATDLGRRMVTQFGMKRPAEDDQSPVPLFFEPDTYKMTSEEHKESIDKEIQGMISDSYRRAMELLTKHKSELQHVAQALVEFETLSANEIDYAIKNEMKKIEHEREKRKKKNI